MKYILEIIVALSIAMGVAAFIFTTIKILNYNKCMNRHSLALFTDLQDVPRKCKNIVKDRVLK